MKKELVKSCRNAEVPILEVYRKWSETSRLQDFQAMYKLTLPGSDFREITMNFKKYLDIGMKCHYELSYIRVMRDEKEGQAMVTGSISLVQSSVGIETKGKFTSTCIVQRTGEGKEVWLLDGMDIEWC
jgi:hypothetical protein